MTVVDRFVQAVSHGGAMKKPTLIVIHSAETPLKAGYAKSIAENWFGKSATTSAHFMIDPVEIIRMLSDNVVSYAVGPKANGFTLNIEQAGYARFSRAEWLTPDGVKQMGKVGALVRELCATRGIPLRFATDAQIKAAATGTPGGICFHDDIRRVLGGTTHNDPMPNYPRDLLLAAGTTVEEDDMPTAAEIADAVWTRRIKTIDSVTTAETILANVEGFYNHAVAAIVNGILDAQIDRSDLQRGPTTLRAVLTWSDNHVDALASGIAAAVSSAQAGSIAGSVDPAAVRKAVQDAVNNITVKVTAS